MINVSESCSIVFCEFLHSNNVFFSSISFRSTTDQELHSSSEYSNDNLNNSSSFGTTDDVFPPDEMVAASKEASQDQPAQLTNAKIAGTSTSDTESMFNVMYSIAKKVSMVGAIYLVGYMNWSVAWLITPVVLAVTREYWQKSSQVRRDIAKASATANEKDVILARIKDLPAWVSYEIERSKKYFVAKTCISFIFPGVFS